jgi:hypothetical protein
MYCPENGRGSGWFGQSKTLPRSSRSDGTWQRRTWALNGGVGDGRRCLHAFKFLIEMFLLKTLFWTALDQFTCASHIRSGLV